MVLYRYLHVEVYIQRYTGSCVQVAVEAVVVCVVRTVPLHVQYVYLYRWLYLYSTGNLYIKPNLSISVLKLVVGVYT